MKLDRILVAVDFSKQSMGALNNADDLAFQSGGTLTLLHVHTITGVSVLDFNFVEQPVDVARITQAAEEQLRRWASDLKTPVERTRVEVNTGDPVTEIVRHTKGHDLLVMGSHGHSGLTHFLLGSVTERVVRAAQCSVLVVR